MLKPLMQFVLKKELKAHSEKDPKQEERAAFLGQELLETLWTSQKKGKIYPK